MGAREEADAVHTVRSRIAALASALAVLAGVVASGAPHPLGATVVSSTVTTSAVSGADRYDTARLAALAAFPSGANEVVLASGVNFPDGLAAASLAGALGAPLLLTPPAALAPETISALTALKVKTVQIVGGTNAVSSGVISQLTTAGYTVPTAIAGTDRYGTAAAIAAAAVAVKAVGTVGGQKTAILAGGVNFPDALAAGAASYVGNIPILLTDPNTLSSAASSEITTLGVTHVIIMGGTNAVSSTVEAVVRALTVNSVNVTTTREQGSTRFGTAAAMATWEITPTAAGGLGMPPTNIVLASGLNFPDALVSAELTSPVLFDGNGLPGETAGFLTANGSSISSIEALGGPNAVPPADLAAAQAAASSTPRSVTISAVASGVSFAVAFSQAVNTPVATNFTINGGAAGAGISAVWAGRTATSYIVLTSNVLDAGDVIAVNSASPPTTLTGTAVQPTTFTVPANLAPSLTGSIFITGGSAIELQFSKPVSTTSLASGLTLTSSGGATLDTTTSHWALSQDSAEVTIPVTAHTIGSGDSLTLANSIVDLTSGTALALSNPQTIHPATSGTAPTISSVHVVSTISGGGGWVFNHTSDASGTGPLPSGDQLTMASRPGSAAAGVGGANYKIAFAAPGAGSTVSVASATSSGVTTVTITVPSTAGDYTSGAALATALNGVAAFNSLFIATGTGSADLNTTVANTAAQAEVISGASTSNIVVTLSSPVVPPSGPYTTATLTNTIDDFNKWTVSGGAVVTQAYPLDDWAAPGVIELSVTASTSAQLIVTGTTTVTFNGTASGFGGNAVATPATATTS